MTDQYLGEIRLLPYKFAPLNWSFARGQLLDVYQNSALYSVIFNIYGGERDVNFCLPNLEAKAPMGAGAGPSLTSRIVGQEYGAASVTLAEQEIPKHRHTMQVSYKTKPESAAPGEDYLPHMMMSVDNAPLLVYNKQPEDYTNMAPETLSTAGSSAAHENCQPYLGLNFCIAMEGTYPPRPK